MLESLNNMKAHLNLPCRQLRPPVGRCHEQPLPIESTMASQQLDSDADGDNIVVSEVSQQLDSDADGDNIVVSEVSQQLDGDADGGDIVVSEMSQFEPTHVSLLLGFIVNTKVGTLAQ